MNEENLLLKLLKTTDRDISTYIFLISECPLIQDKLAIELFDDKIQKIVKKKVKGGNIKAFTI